jgi:DNA modification methylase
VKAGQTGQINASRSYCSLCGAWRGALGLEPTPELYISHLMLIMAEIKRVLRADGICFINLGDSYAGSGRGLNADGKDGGSSDKQLTNAGSVNVVKGVLTGNLKPKDLCLIPERFALAVQQQGWWVRSRICWNKLNPMPESVQDRPTDSWEHIWMLTKSARYFWDAEAVREPQTGNAHSRGTEACNEAYQAARGSYKGFNSPAVEVPGGRNLRSVWSFPTAPFPKELKAHGEHFATFPPELPARCIKAATSEKGCCPKCGSPWVRIVERKVNDFPKAQRHGPYTDTGANSCLTVSHGENYQAEVKTLGWKASCSCGGEPIPCTVLDPFAGSGTTLQVAAELGRKAIGCELSEEYCRLIMERNKQEVMNLV